jgi:flagellar basal body-associated protein FliL
MTDEDKKKTPEPPSPKKSSPGALSLLLPALVAGLAAFGGSRLSAARAASGGGAAAEHTTTLAPVPPPGPTVALEPFLVLTQDASKKSHAMKVTIAVEFNESTKEEALKSFTPRIRDATLGYLRLVSYEDALDNTKTEKFKADLLERYRTVGAITADRVLITDLVVQ